MGKRALEDQTQQPDHDDRHPDPPGDVPVEPQAEPNHGRTRQAERECELAERLRVECLQVIRLVRDCEIAPGPYPAQIVGIA